MDKETFAEHFHVATTATVDFARKFILEPLPDAKIFRVRLNQSYDKNPASGEKIYPEDGTIERRHQLRQCTEAEVVEVLWRKGSVPEWVDLSVVALNGTQTVVELLCCGRFISDEKSLYHQQEGYVPFHILGPNLPAGYKHGDRFSIWRRLEVWSRGELEQAGPHIQKVRLLTLLGNEFDDSALLKLPVFPSMEVLALEHSHTCGEGLQSQSKHPKLRELNVALAHPEGFRLSNVPTFPALETLRIHSLPTRACGLEELVCRLPNLNSLTLQSNGNVFLDMAIPQTLRYLAISGNNIQGAVRLPREVESLSLHLRESTALDLERLFRPVESIKSLFLRGTKLIDDRFVEQIVSRFALDYIDVVETNVSADCLRRLAQEHPSLRMHPCFIS